MNAFILLIPFILIRFALLFILNKEAVQRAAVFAPMDGIVKIVYYIYQISNIIIFLYLPFLTIKLDFSWQFYLGIFCYLTGLLLCAIAVINFSFPSNNGLNTNGIYHFSRNPMYVAYFICFMGFALLTQSAILLGTVFIFQLSSHWVILAEERWCINKFGSSYSQYKKAVRRYF